MVCFKKGILILLPLLLSLSIAAAGDDKFQNTSEEMIKELTRPPVKYRSFGMSKKRAIKVVQRVDNKIEEKVVMIDENADIPRLKLKIEFDYNSTGEWSLRLINNAGYS